MRGEWYVVGQLVLMALVFLGPRKWLGWPASSLSVGRAGPYVGAALILVGIGLLADGLIRLGSGLTALPYPKEHTTLVTTGPYRYVRHPMYGGGILAGLGWALWVGSWLTLGYVAVLFVFLDRKASREEQWLEEKFSGYREYRRRVRRLIPFVY
jgi:protein-S-isoprenylcysteine O-methyltransferase Ste14